MVKILPNIFRFTLQNKTITQRDTYQFDYYKIKCLKREKVINISIYYTYGWRKFIKEAQTCIGNKRNRFYTEGKFSAEE